MFVLGFMGSKKMIVRILAVSSLSLAAAQAHAAYRCELFDRAENAPGGDVPAKVLFTDSDNIEDAKAACSALVDQRNYVDYWLKWVPTNELPADWKNTNLLPTTLVKRTIVDCKGDIFGSGLPSTEEKPLAGGEVTSTGFYPAADSKAESMRQLSLRLFVPGFLIEGQEYTHLATFNLNKIELEKVEVREGHNQFLNLTPVSGSTIDITTEGDTQKAKISGIVFAGGAADFIDVSLTYAPEGGVTRTESYSIWGGLCGLNW
jgi:hypothetical protein